VGGGQEGESAEALSGSDAAVSVPGGKREWGIVVFVWRMREDVFDDAAAGQLSKDCSYSCTAVSEGVIEKRRVIAHAE